MSRKSISLALFLLGVVVPLTLVLVAYISLQGAGPYAGFELFGAMFLAWLMCAFVFPLSIVIGGDEIRHSPIVLVWMIPAIAILVAVAVIPFLLLL